MNDLVIDISLIFAILGVGVAIIAAICWLCFRGSGKTLNLNTERAELTYNSDKLRTEREVLKGKNFNRNMQIRKALQGMTYVAHARCSKKLSAVIPMLSDVAQQYGNSVRNEICALNTVEQTPLAMQIAERQRSRKAVFYTFIDIVEVLKDHYDSLSSQMAEQLSELLYLDDETVENHLQYEEITEINNFLDALRAPEMQKVLEKLNIKNWFAKLEEENAKFMKLIPQQPANGYLLENIRRLYSARHNTDRYLFSLINTHNSNNIKSGANNDDAFLLQIENIVGSR